MNKRLLLAAAPVIFLLLWSAGFAIAKLGLQHAEPLTLLALRYSVVLALLIPLALITRPPLPKTLRGAADVALVGFLIQVVYFGLAYVAFKSGISAGGLLVFILALGYYITPLLLGGAGDQLLPYYIAFNTTQTVNWGLAASLGAILLAATFLLYGVYVRLVGVDRIGLG